MKVFIVVLSVVALTMGQRPTYAGRRPIGRPELASRFREENETTTVRVNVRVGDGTTERIPVDARGDYDLVNRLQQWPKEHRPFWLINAEHIETQRNQNILQQQFEEQRRQQQQQQQQQQQNFDQDDEQPSGVFTQTRIGSNNDFETIPIRPNEPRPSFAGR